MLLNAVITAVICAGMAKVFVISTQHGGILDFVRFWLTDMLAKDEFKDTWQDMRKKEYVTKAQRANAYENFWSLLEEESKLYKAFSCHVCLGIRWSAYAGLAGAFVLSPDVLHGVLYYFLTVALTGIIASFI